MLQKRSLLGEVLVGIRHRRYDLTQVMHFINLNEFIYSHHKVSNCNSTLGYT